ncbi:MAG TPA: hypothetical protein VIU61_07790 [Kofleriaceae bacterium]
MVGRILVCALVGCGQPDAGGAAPAKPAEITPVQLVDAGRASTPPDAPAAAPAITISARKQIFTTKIGPGHVWFELRNTGAAATMEVVRLEYVDGGIASPVDISSILLGDSQITGTSMTVAPGDGVLDLTFDTTMIPRDRDAYLFRVTAKVDGVEISGESTVRYARRIPIRP